MIDQIRGDGLTACIDVDSGYFKRGGSSEETSVLCDYITEQC